MHGILIVDKPAGMTSNDVVRRVRRLLGTRRVGHCGTLDPMATGILPVAVGEGTRLVQFLMDGDKSYRATLRLGETTDTQDAEGTVLECRDWHAVDEPAVRLAAAAFVGPLQQIPPMYSALKRDGVPLYRLARQGVEVERAPRSVSINRLEVLGVELPLVTIEVDCSKGTYIRTLAHDLGSALGVGAHLVALRRTRHGRFDEMSAVTLEQLEQLLAAGERPPLLGPRTVLASLPQLELSAEAARRLCNGIPPVTDETSNDTVCGDLVLLLHAGRLLAIARFAPQRSLESRGDFELLTVFPQGAQEP